MEIFVDTASIEEIKQARDYGVLDGVTTNPSLLKKAVDSLRKQGRKINIEAYVKQIMKACKGKPVSLEVIGGNAEELERQGRLLYQKFNHYKNSVIKIPVNPSMKEKNGLRFDGIKAIKKLSSSGIPVNTTLVMSTTQALLAAKAGATYVSPFAGRIDDYLRARARIKFEKHDYYPAEGLLHKNKLLNDEGIRSGVDLIASIRTVFDQYGFKTKILAASLRNRRQVREVAESGADVATLPFSVLQDLVEHPKTLEGMQKFVKDTPEEYKKLLKYSG